MRIAAKIDPTEIEALEALGIRVLRLFKAGGDFFALIDASEDAISKAIDTGALVEVYSAGRIRTDLEVCPIDIATLLVLNPQLKVIHDVPENEGEGVKVAVVDSGLANHPFFQTRACKR